MTDEADKLRKHLALLREEFVKLQQKHVLLERKYEVLLAKSGTSDAEQSDSFVARLLKTISDVLESACCADVTVQLRGRTTHAHKLVLLARSDCWASEDTGADWHTLDLSDVANEVGSAFLKWLYTDQLEIVHDDAYLLDLMRLAARFRISPLMRRCEQALTTFVSRKNCLHFFRIADELRATELERHCAEMIAANWNDFEPDEFAELDAAVLYKLIKLRTRFALHAAVRLRRDDVLFLFLVEHDADKRTRLNELDERGASALDLALAARLESIAHTLVTSGADVNVRDADGYSPLQHACARFDEFSTSFLLRNGADVNAANTSKESVTCLHLLADAVELVRDPDRSGRDKPTVNSNMIVGSPAHPHFFFRKRPLRVGRDEQSVTSASLSSSNSSALSDSAYESAAFRNGASVASEEDLEALARITEQVLLKGGDPNSRDSNGDTPLHVALRHANNAFFNVVVQHAVKIDLTAINVAGDSLVWCACVTDFHRLGVTQLDDIDFDSDMGTNHGLPVSFARRLIRSVPPHTSVRAVLDCRAPATGDTLLHRLADNRIEQFALFALASGADVNTTNNRRETPLHIATRRSLSKLCAALLRAGASPNAQWRLPSSTASSPSLKQSEQTPAQATDGEVELQTPFHIAIESRNDSIIRLFVAALNNSNNNGMRPDLRLKDANGNTVFSAALWTGMFEIATQILVGFASSVSAADEPTVFDDFDAEGNSLLHQAIRRRAVKAAAFLLEQGADANQPTRPPVSPGISTRSAVRKPIELSIRENLPEIVEALCRKKAVINYRMPLDSAVDSRATNNAAVRQTQPERERNRNPFEEEEQPPPATPATPGRPQKMSTNRLNADLCDWTCPLWLALHHEDQVAGERIAAILVRYGCDTTMWGPSGTGCEQTLLHRAIHEANERVAVFLIRNRCDINSPRRVSPNAKSNPATDATRGLVDEQTPLHLARRLKF